MATLADSLVSSASRRLRLRIRPDLIARRHAYQGQVSWVVKDPLGLNYFRFQEEEYALLEMLDGRASLQDLKDQFERQYAPQKITLEELQQFIGSLHRSGLVIADAAGQGLELKKRSDERKWKELKAKFSNILSIRFRGIDPDRLLNRTYWMVRWMFSPWAVAAVLLLGFSALALVTVHADEFYSRLPGFHQFFTAKNAFLLGLTLAITKIIHEFGHAFSAKHFGGECHEMGVLILVLTPCLYCNVSDSWLLPNKWQRAAIGAAGMYVELVIASICTWVWWFSEPGLLNHLCLSTMFVCSISTLVFNGNPLMKYDGYYILSDILEIPNLRQKSSQILQRLMGKYCLGMKQPPDPFLPQRNQWMFAVYTVAAAVYRWVVVFSILWFLYEFFKPYRLEIIGQAIAMASLYGLLVMPIVQMVKFFWVPGRVDQVKRKNLLITLGVAAAIIAAIVLVPLPYSVICTLEIKARDAANIYVDVPGTLESIAVRPGDQVKPGQTLAQLSNVDIGLTIAGLERQRDKQLAQLEDLKRQQHDDAEAANEIPRLEEELASTEQQLLQKQIDFQRLTIVSPAAGMVLPPPVVPYKPIETQLVSWSGTPLQHKNVGAFLTPSVLFCQVGDPKRMQANLVIDQSDIEFVEAGQVVDIKLDELPHDTIDGKIAEIAKIELEYSPRNLSNKAGGELPTRTDEAGQERPLSTSYQAHVPIDDPDEKLALGLRGRAKVHTDPQTIGQRLWRYFIRTFNFRL